MDSAPPSVPVHDVRLEFEPGEEPPPEMFRAIAETAVDPFVIVGDDGVLRWVGESIEELLGWRADELVGRSMDVIIAPSSLPDVLAAFAGLGQLTRRTDPRGGVGQSAELLCRDGTTTACTLVAAIRARTGLPYHLVFARRAGYERALDNVIGAIAEHADLGDVLAHLVTTLQQTIPRCVVAIGEGWQGDRFAVTAGNGLDLLVDDPASPWSRAMTRGEDVLVPRVDELPPALAVRARARGLESCWVHPVGVAGDERPSAALVMWRPFEGVPTRFTWDAVQRAGRLLGFTMQWDRSHQALAFAAAHDPLTGLANRQAFLGRLAEITRPAEGAAAVLFIDLDRFKPVNDGLGHLAGDRVLQAVAERLAAAVRPGDLVARIGGDEFAVLCERLGEPGDVDVVATRLIEAVEPPFPLEGGHEVSITASVGVTELAGAEDPELVLARADQAMRRAKAQGPGRCVNHQPPA